MAIGTNTRDTLTPREYELHNQRKEMFEMQAQHELAVKERELEVMRLEAKWGSWMKLPIMILMLPIRVVLAIAFIPSVFVKKELPDEYWHMLK